MEWHICMAWSTRLLRESIEAFQMIFKYGVESMYSLECRVSTLETVFKYEVGLLYGLECRVSVIYLLNIDNNAQM